MNITSSRTTKLILSDLDSLDPVTVFAEDLSKGHGQITILCYGKAWTTYWGGIGGRSITEFFCDCDEHYAAKNLSDIKSEVYDLDAIRKQAEERGIECWRDDPWHDYEFLTEMYGNDMMGWSHSLPTRPNPDYRYLCRIIKAVQQGFLELKKTEEPSRCSCEDDHGSYTEDGLIYCNRCKQKLEGLM